MIDKPKPKEVWTHRNGNMYEVLFNTNVDSDIPEYPETVVYRNVVNEKLYSRPLSDWHRSMTKK